MKLVFETNKEGDWQAAYLLLADSTRIYIWQGHSYSLRYFMFDFIDAINRAGVKVDINTLEIEHREVDFEQYSS